MRDFRVSSVDSVDTSSQQDRGHSPFFHYLLQFNRCMHLRAHQVSK